MLFWSQAAYLLCAGSASAGKNHQGAASTILRLKRAIRDDNSALVLVLPYLTAEYVNNRESFERYYDEIEICEAAAGGHYKSAIQTRNREMVDRSDLVVCCIERERGGAYQAVKYAQKQGKQTVNVAVEGEKESLHRRGAWG